MLLGDTSLMRTIITYHVIQKSHYCAQAHARKRARARAQFYYYLIIIYLL